MWLPFLESFVLGPNTSYPLELTVSMNACTKSPTEKYRVEEESRQMAILAFGRNAGACVRGIFVIEFLGPGRPMRVSKRFRNRTWFNSYFSKYVAFLTK